MCMCARVCVCVCVRREAAAELKRQKKMLIQTESKLDEFGKRGECVGGRRKGCRFGLDQTPALLP